MAQKQGKLRSRIVLDIAMTIMLVVLMFYNLTGNTLHEILGIAFFLAIFAHLGLSAKWARGVSRSMAHGRASRRSKTLAIFAIVLLAVFVLLIVSSIAISHLLDDAGLGVSLGLSYNTWATIHAFTAYALCALVVVHLAMHWKSFGAAFHVPYSPARRAAITTCVRVTAGVGVVALGAAAANTLKPLAQAAESASSTSSGATGGASGDETLSVSDKPLTDAQKEPAASDGAAVESNANSATAESESGSASSSSSSPSSNSNGPSASNTTGSTNAPNASNNSGSSSSSSNVSGTCPLCRKQCSLSAPKCDKPYRQGLI